MNRHAIYLHEENRRGTGLEGKSPECSPDKCLGLFSVSDTPDSLISCYFLSVSMLKLPWWLSGKESACSAGAAGDVGSNPWLGKSPRGGHGNPHQYSCLENPTDRGAWQAIVHRVTKSQT